MNAFLSVTSLIVCIISGLYSAGCALIEVLARTIIGYPKFFELLQRIGIVVNDTAISIFRISAFAAIVIFLLSGIVYKNITQWEFCIFQDFSDCHRIELNKTDDATVTKLVPVEHDKHIYDLEYAQSYCVAYTSVKLNFELYSYAFSNPDSACTYYRRVTKMPIINPNHYWVWIYPKFWKICYINNHNVYVIYAPDAQAAQVEQYFKKCFPLQ